MLRLVLPASQTSLGSNGGVFCWLGGRIAATYVCSQCAHIEALATPCRRLREIFVLSWFNREFPCSRLMDSTLDATTFISLWCAWNGFCMYSGVMCISSINLLLFLFGCHPCSLFRRHNGWSDHLQINGNRCRSTPLRHYTLSAETLQKPRCW